MPTLDDFESKLKADLTGSEEVILNDPSDATDTGQWRIATSELAEYLQENFNISNLTTAEVTSYLSTLNFIGYDGTDNKRITFENIKSVLQGTSGLDLDSMYDSAGVQLLAGGQQAAITALTDSTGGTPGDTISGNSVAGVTDSTGGSTADATLGACTDTTTTDQSGTINDNFAKVAVCLNALVSALNNGDDMASVTTKINALIQDFKDIGLMAT